MQKLITEHDLCKKLGVVRKTLWTWRSEGMPIVVQYSGVYRYKYDLKEVLQWVSDNNKKVKKVG